MDMAVNHSPLRFLLLTGDADDMVHPSHAENFSDSLNGAGHQASLENVGGADHIDLIRPHVVGDLIRPHVVGDRIVSFVRRHPETA